MCCQSGKWVISPLQPWLPTPALPWTTQSLQVNFMTPHPSSLPYSSATASSNASKVTDFHLQQHRFNSQTLSSFVCLWFHFLLVLSFSLALSLVVVVVVVVGIFSISPPSAPLLPPCHQPACCSPHWHLGPGTGPCHLQGRRITIPDWLEGTDMPPYKGRKRRGCDEGGRRG